MQDSSWQDDYITTYNILSGQTLGSATQAQLSIAAALLSTFKRLVDYVISAEPPSGISISQSNPFDLKGNQ